MGFVELYNEDGTKRYFTSQTQMSSEKDIDPLEMPAFLTSCVGYFGADNDE